MTEPGRGLIVAAPASGSGKTLVVAGLLRQLARRGHRLAAAKAGPDFIDPSFHQLAAGVHSVNLDLWAMRPATLAAAVAALGRDAELILCEGVMGLFDGTGDDGEGGSTAALAAATGWPVVLVVDAGGQGASVAALLRGFVTHRPEIPIIGVIFNRVSSPRHRALLSEAVARHVPALDVLGAIPADPRLGLPSRHLGLVPAGEWAGAEAVVAHAAEQIAAGLDIDRLMARARPARESDAEAAATPGIPPLGQMIAVARDEAFCFAYPSLLQGWRGAGAELAFFSPLANEPPDSAADAVYLPGGFPELWAARLAAADRFMTGLRAAAARGSWIYGECGGYMVLGEALIDAQGSGHAMAALLPLATSFATPRRHLGYRAVRLCRPTALGAAGGRFRGHEFHYATALRETEAPPLWSVTDAAGRGLGECGLQRGRVFGSFIHLIDRCD